MKFAKIEELFVLHHAQRPELALGTKGLEPYVLQVDLRGNHVSKDSYKLLLLAHGQETFCNAPW